MADINLRAQPLNVFGGIGDDMVITLTVVDADGAAIDVSGYTISADVLRAGSSIATFTDAVSGAGNNVITLTLSDTQTTSIGTERQLRWSLSMTTGGLTEQWVGGKFELLNPGHPKAVGNNAATLTYTTGDVTVTLGAISTSALDGRYLLPDGGTTGQALVKASAADRDTEWGEGAPAATATHSAVGPHWYVTDGAVSISGTNLGAAGRRVPGALFDGAALESVTFIMPLPLVTSIDLWVEWVNPSATAGDVVWQVSYELLGPDNTIDSFTAGSQITATSPAQNVITQTRLVSGLTRGDAESIVVKLLRRGDVAGDTVNSVDVAAIGMYAKQAA